MSTRFFPGQDDYIDQLNGMDDDIQAAGSPTAASIGLGSVDNTSDLNKPLSTAAVAALAAKQDTSGKNASGGYAGLSLFKLQLVNNAGTFISTLQNAATAARAYTLPDSSGNLALTSDIPSAYTLPAATSSVLGGVKVGSGLSIDGSNVLSATAYSLPIAGASTLGGIKVGSGLSIDGAGVLIATGATTGSVTSVNSITPVTGNVTLTTNNISENTNLYFTAARVLAAVMTGLSTATNAVVAATDTLLVSVGKLQAQISGVLSSVGANSGIAPLDSGGKVPTANLPQLGLANFTESVNRASPNATVSVVQLLATATETNVDAVFAAKGTGAILAHTPTATSTGGNKRGANAVDLQSNRTSSTSVASGAQSTIGGGSDNRASAQYATIPGGRNNFASNTAAVIAGGDSNQATATYTSVCGGQSNQALATYAFIGGGSGNHASANYSLISGGANGRANTCIGMQAWAGVARNFSQMSEYLLTVDTTDATPTVLTAQNAASASATNQVALEFDSMSFYCTIEMLVRKADGSCASGTSKVLIRRGSGVGTTAIVGSPTFTTDFATGITIGGVAFAADTTNGALKITVTGIASTSLSWFCYVRAVELSL